MNSTYWSVSVLPSGLPILYLQVAMVKVPQTMTSHQPVQEFQYLHQVLVAEHLFAFMTSTCILPSIEAVSNMHSLKSVKKSLHEHMHCHIELAWAFIIVMLLFLNKVLLFF